MPPFELLSGFARNLTALSLIRMIWELVTLQSEHATREKKNTFW